MAHTIDSQRTTTRRWAALLRTDAQLTNGNALGSRRFAALFAFVMRGGRTGIGRVEMRCQALAIGTYR